MIKKTKIVATLGLVSDKKEIIREMIKGGMNVARLNFSHGSYLWHRNVIEIIRELSKKMGMAVGIMADIQGPRIRTMVQTDIKIKTGDFVLVSDIAKSPNFEFLIPNFESTSNDKISNAGKFLLDIKDIVNDIEVGNEILIEDGLMKIVVREKNNGILLAEVIDGGIIKNHKGVNIPDAQLHISPITEKDEKDLEFSLAQEVDFVAMSFVSTGADIESLREKIKKILGRENDLPQIVAKIERKEAIKNLDDIIDHADVVMVARGDLGIEEDESKVGILQKDIIHKSLKKMKPVIVATQMLNSMIENPRPTRAEVNDVTNAVIDHADAVMLSGESASGKYPLESVRIMKEIIENTEVSPFDDVKHLLAIEGKEEFKKMVQNTYDFIKKSNAGVIAVGSVSGYAARLLSHLRFEKTLLVATNNKKTYNQLSLVWGAEEVYVEEQNLSLAVEQMIEHYKSIKEINTGDIVAMALEGSSEEEVRLVEIKTI